MNNDFFGIGTCACGAQAFFLAVIKFPDGREERFCDSGCRFYRAARHQADAAWKVFKAERERARRGGARHRARAFRPPMGKVGHRPARQFERDRVFATRPVAPGAAEVRVAGNGVGLREAPGFQREVEGLRAWAPPPRARGGEKNKKKEKGKGKKGKGKGK